MVRPVVGAAAFLVACVGIGTSRPPALAMSQGFLGSTNDSREVNTGRFDLDHDGAPDRAFLENTGSGAPVIWIVSGDGQRAIQMLTLSESSDAVEIGVIAIPDPASDGFNFVVLSPRHGGGDHMGRGQAFSGHTGTLIATLGGDPDSRFGVGGDAIDDADGDAIADFRVWSAFARDGDGYEFATTFSSRTFLPISDTRTHPELISLRADLDGDGVVDARDVRVVQEALGTFDRRSDISGDGIVDLVDLAAVIRQIGRRTSAPPHSGPDGTGSGGPGTTGTSTEPDPTCADCPPKPPPDPPFDPPIITVPGDQPEDPCDLTSPFFWWTNNDDDNCDAHFDKEHTFPVQPENDFHAVGIAGGPMGQPTESEEWYISYGQELKVWYRLSEGDINAQATPPMSSQTDRQVSFDSEDPLATFRLLPSGQHITGTPPNRTLYIEGVSPSTVRGGTHFRLTHIIRWRDSQNHLWVTTVYRDISITMNQLEIVVASGDQHSLEIGHWGADSVPPTTLDGYTPAGAVKNGAGANGTFIDNDPDRYIVRLNMPHQPSNPPGPGSALVALGTGVGYGPVITIDDAETNVTLTETANNSGIFESEPQLLMSPDLPTAPDDGYQVWSNVAGGLVSDGQLDDRTRRTRLLGSLRATYTWEVQTVCDPPTFETRVHQLLRPVNDRLNPANGVKTLHLRVRAYLEPVEDIGVDHDGSASTPKINLNQDTRFVDSNGNGKRDVGEVLFYDSNHNGVADTGEPAVTQIGGTITWPLKWDAVLVSIVNTIRVVSDRGFDFVDGNGDSEHQAGERSERFRDHSSYVALGPAGQNPPPPLLSGDQAPQGSWGAVVSLAYIDAQVGRANISWAQARVRVVVDGSTIIEPAPFGVLGSDPDGWFDVFPPPIGAHHDQIVIPAISGAVSNRAEVIFTGPMVQAAGYTRMPGNQGSSLGANSGNTYIFIAPGNPTAIRTLAHEIGHALTNQGDVPPVDYLFFPFAAQQPQDTAVNKSRRLLHDTENTAHTTRPPGPGNLGQPGNTLLQSP